jgi:hypothetical protein
MKHVGVVFNPANPSSAVQMRGAEEAARALGLQFEIVEARIVIFSCCSSEPSIKRATRPC